MTIKRLVAGIAIAFAFASPDLAAVNVGDKPQLSFQAVDGSPVSLEKLKGHIVVVDFWATWCGPCMAMAPEMVQINKQYGDKGLQMIGISLDSDKASLAKVVKQQGFNWPQYFDGQGWGNKFWKQWGENGIPFTVLLGPDGSVLWKGHPGAGLKKEIEKAFREHPPQLVDPKTVAAANELLDEIEGKSKAGETGAAMKLLARVPEDAKNDGDTAARLTEVRSGLEAQAEQMIGEVDPLVAKGQYVAAINKLKDLGKALAGTPAGNKARKKLADLMNNPEARAQAEAADRSSRAEEALAVAQGLQKNKKDDLAYFRFKQITKDFADTDSARLAAAEVKRYEADPKFVERVIQKENAGRAKAALSMARSYRTANKIEQARKKYQSIIDEYPGTSFANTARAEMDALGK